MFAIFFCRQSSKLEWRLMDCIVIIIITTTIFIVLSSWPRSIARVHSVHLVNVEVAADTQTWAVSPPVLGSYCLQPPSPFIIITQPKSWILLLSVRVIMSNNTSNKGKVAASMPVHLRSIGCRPRKFHKNPSITVLVILLSVPHTHRQKRDSKRHITFSLTWVKL